jgi:hypothetical protein
MDPSRRTLVAVAFFVHALPPAISLRLIIGRRLWALAVEEPRMTSFTVRRNTRYRATIRLGLLEQLAGNETIPDHLREAGFADVSVEGAGETRLAEATWPLDDATAPLPPQVASVSESKDG